MKWEFVIETKSENIQKVEQELDYIFPDDFKKCVLKNNAGSLIDYVYYLSNGEEKVFGSLLSFNENDKEYILKYNNKNNKLVFISFDPFGNKLAFDKSTNNIVYYAHETDETIFLASSWTSLEKNLIDLNNINIEEINNDINNSLK